MLLTPEERIIISMLNNSISNDLFNRDVDWIILHNILINQKIFLIGFKRLKNYIPKEYIGLFGKTYLQINQRMKNYDIVMKKIIKLSKQHKINAIFIKGFILSEMLYNDLFVRDFSDIDILLENENDLVEMKLAMNEIGFYNSYLIDGKVLQIKEPSNNIRGVYHEFSFAKYEKQEYLWVELKEATSAIKKDIITLFNKNKVKIEMYGDEIYTYDLTHTFLHLCSNTYGNSERRFLVEKNMCLRDYLDIYMFIQKFKNHLDWNEISQLANQYRILHKIFYILNNIKKIFSDLDFIDKNVIDLFDLSKMSYLYSLTKEATIIEWETPFVNRFFMSGFDRFQEYEKLYYYRTYSKLNINSEKNTKLYIDHDNAIKNVSYYEKIKCTDDSNVEFLYMFTQDDNNIYINILIPKTKIEYFDDLFFDFDFYYNPMIEKENIKIIRISIINNQIYCTYGNRIVLLEGYSSLTDFYMLNIKIEKDFFDSKCPSVNKIAYNIYVFKTPYVLGNPIIVGIKYGDFMDLEESPNLGFLSIGED